MKREGEGGRVINLYSQCDKIFHGMYNFLWEYPQLICTETPVGMGEDRRGGCKGLQHAIALALQLSLRACQFFLTDSPM